MSCGSVVRGRVARPSFFTCAVLIFLNISVKNLQVLIVHGYIFYLQGPTPRLPWA